MINRTFYEVGNGLFVYESNYFCNAVYDCGGQNRATIESAIDRFLLRSKHIQFLFISHYDRDHINGLEYLLTNCKVDYVILPMITWLCKIVIYSDTHEYWGEESFVLDPESYIHKYAPETKVLFVESIGESRDEDSQQNFNPIDYSELPTIKKLPNRISLKVLYWSYCIYNHRVLTDVELKTYLSKMGLTVESSPDEIVDAIKQRGYRTLKKGLKSIFTDNEIRNINDYSMVVWSGFDYEFIYPKFGCLYTGDYNAKNNSAVLLRIYNELLPYCTGIIQIPHHGSKNNYDQSITFGNTIHVISASKGPYRSRSVVNPGRVIRNITSRKLDLVTTFDNDVIILFK